MNTNFAIASAPQLFTPNTSHALNSFRYTTIIHILLTSLGSLSLAFHIAISTTNTKFCALYYELQIRICRFDHMV